MDQKINIQWFPGHMAKAKRLIEQNLRLVDALCEVIDARIPISSRNPDLDALAGGTPRLIVLNRMDQADAAVTKRWVEYFKSRGYEVLETDSKTGKGVNGFATTVRRLLKDRLAALAAKGQTGRTVRAMVAGIPNVGKSSFINHVAKRKAALTSDRPGVTRGKQWISVDGALELLDTPGILWPRFDSQTVGENLFFTGAIKDDVADVETMGARLFERLRDEYPGAVTERYKIDLLAGDTGFDILERAGKKRGFLSPGGEVDLARMAVILLDEFRGGKLGRVTLETPDSLQSL